jgi:hypothetical protein
MAGEDSGNGLGGNTILDEEAQLGKELGQAGWFYFFGDTVVSGQVVKTIIGLSRLEGVGNATPEEFARRLGIKVTVDNEGLLYNDGVVIPGYKITTFEETGMLEIEYEGPKDDLLKQFLKAAITVGNDLNRKEIHDATADFLLACHTEPGTALDPIREHGLRMSAEQAVSQPESMTPDEKTRRDFMVMSILDEEVGPVKEDMPEDDKRWQRVARISHAQAYFLYPQPPFPKECVTPLAELEQNWLKKHDTLPYPKHWVIEEPKTT